MNQINFLSFLYMNGQEVFRQSKIFNISSISCDEMYNGSKLSNGTWSIPNFICHFDNVREIYFSVEHCEVPCSFYLINQYNNTIALLVSNQISFYYIDYGNYDALSMLSKLTSILPSWVTVTYSKTNNKYTFTSTTYLFGISSTSSTCSQILGLNTTSDMWSTGYSGTYILQLPYAVNFFPLARINFRCGILNIDNYQAEDKSNDVFLSLQNSANQNGMIYHYNISGLRYAIDLEQLSRLDIRITDDKNREIDFNNSPWYLTLRIDVEYYNKKQETNLIKLIKENNKYLIEKYSED